MDKGKYEALEKGKFDRNKDSAERVNSRLRFYHSQLETHFLVATERHCDDLNRTVGILQNQGKETPRGFVKMVRLSSI